MLTENITLKTDPNSEEVLSYLDNCDLMNISENKFTKSLYFKDSNDDISCLIYSLSNSSCTILATINGMKYNGSVVIDDFRKFFNKYKIFIIK